MFTVMLFHADVTAKSYSKYKYRDLIIIIMGFSWTDTTTVKHNFQPRPNSVSI